jgi:large conductance mechanosensitive channel
MSLVKDFKDFAMKGNVVDMAVGIVIGVAFGKIVSSFVKDVLMPPIGLITGGVDFSDKSIVLKSAGTAADGTEIPAVLLNYGMFANTIIDFLIVSFAIFMVIKVMNSAKKKEEAAPPAKPPAQEVLLTEIRDLLKQKV